MHACRYRSDADISTAEPCSLSRMSAIAQKRTAKQSAGSIASACSVLIRSIDGMGSLATEFDDPSPSLRSNGTGPYTSEHPGQPWRVPRLGKNPIGVARRRLRKQTLKWTRGHRSKGQTVDLLREIRDGSDQEPKIVPAAVEPTINRSETRMRIVGARSNSGNVVGRNLCHWRLLVRHCVFHLHFASGGTTR